jgi:hypothetical protein
MILFLAWAGAAAAEDYATARKKALEPTEKEFAAILAAHPGDAALGQLRERLTVIEWTTDSVLRRLETVRSSSVDKLIQHPAAPAASGKATSAMGAADILQDVAGDFAAELPAPGVSDREREVLVRHYESAVAAAVSYVARRAGTVAGLDDRAAAEAAQLSLVLPFLTVPDPAWNERDVAALPEWVRKPKPLAVAESFALSVNRPQSAYQFALFARKFSDKPTETAAPPTPIEYYRRTAARLVEARDYAGAIRCLRAGIRLAEAGDGSGAGKTPAAGIAPKVAKKPEATTKPEAAADSANKQTDAAALREQLAAAYEATGHPELAAEEMKQQMKADLSAEQYGRSALLRLKYLYASDKLKEIPPEALAYRSDRRCETVLPQILYIEWSTLRRLDRQEEAKRVQATFLERFPDNVLGADMYFANAVTALAASDHEEAVRQLDIIEARYPQSKLVPRAKEIRGRLESSGAPKP